MCRNSNKKCPLKKSPSAIIPYVKRNLGIRDCGYYFLALVTLLILLSPLYYGYVLKTFSSTCRWIVDIGHDTHYRTYKNFNIRIPYGYQIHGIDVSYAQGKINWQKVGAMKEGSIKVNFVFIKATEGLLTVDPYFKRNWREAPKAGIVCGAYHFLRPNKSGEWQTRFFLQNVKMGTGDLPAVADIERLDGTTPETMRKELHAFLYTVASKTKIKPIIYTNINFYQQYLKGYFDEYLLWIAHYHAPELNFKPDKQWRFWQHSDAARINGITHVVDFNVFKGDSVDFKSILSRPNK